MLTAFTLSGWGDLFTELEHAPHAKLLFLFGLGFLAVAVLGKVGSKIDPGKSGRIMAGVLGPVLLIVGLVMDVREHHRVDDVPAAPPSDQARTQPIEPTQKHTRSSASGAGRTEVPAVKEPEIPPITSPAPPVSKPIRDAITNFQLLDDKGNYLVFSVDYDYSGDRGADVYLTGYALQRNGTMVPGTSQEYLPLPVGRGTLQLRVNDRIKTPGPISGIFLSTAVVVCMGIRGQPRGFACQPFSYAKQWVFGALPAQPNLPVKVRNLISNFRVVEYQLDATTISVDYSYNGDYGSSDILIVAVPLGQDGTPSHDVYGEARPITAGQGQVTLHLRLGKASGPFFSSLVQVCMQADKEKPFYCDRFKTKQLRWFR